MKGLVALAAGLLFAGSAIPISTSQFSFNGEVQADTNVSTAFGLKVWAGYVQFVDLEPGLRLELAAPREDGTKAVTLVRLLQEDGGYYKILHEAQISGSSTYERSFSYRVCGSEVTFFTPAPTKTPECAAESP